jgi:predicted cupin superfamily sugar epimerase
MNQRSANDWINHLKLEIHPEGGAYSRVYTSQIILDKTSLPGNFHGSRPACTHIYYLLQKNEFSAFHKIQSDELWHFYDGDTLIISEINKDGSLTKHLLGKNIEAGESLFCVINAGNWFASSLKAGGLFSLVGCTVCPGFDFAEFELAKRNDLISKYPQHKELISGMTK